MRLVASTRLPPTPARSTADHDAERIAAPSASRSLVTVSAPTLRRHVLTRYPRPSAPFLAQLIANAQQAPQTRARRQAEPAEAVARYSVAQPSRTGKLLRSTA